MLLLLVNVEIAFGLVAIPSELKVVSIALDFDNQKCLEVLDSLALPDNVNLLVRDLTELVYELAVAVPILDDGFLGNATELVLVHTVTQWHDNPFLKSRDQLRGTDPDLSYKRIAI